jgi:hypothetical protein
MRFQRFVIPAAYPDASRYFEYMEGVKQHWKSLGWEGIPKADEPAIKAAWIAHLEPAGGKVQIPKPSLSWRRISVAELSDQAEEVEADFTLKVLAAFRRCTRPGERLLAIDWQHPWYYLDPHSGITVATRDEWAMPVLPDGDSYNYVSSDFRFGVLTGWDRQWTVSLFGAELLAAFSADPPVQFLRVCGPGMKNLN